MAKEFSNFVLFGAGWHNIEYINKDSHVWSTSENEIWFQYRFEKVDLIFECCPLNADPIFVTCGSDEKKYDVFVGENEISIDIDHVKSIKIRCSTFVPCQTIEESTDTRELGIKLTGLKVHYCGKSYPIDISDIQSKRYTELKHQATLSLSQTTPRISYVKTLGGIFDKVYCISKMGDHLRRNLAIQQYADHRIDAEFMPALDTELVPDNIQITKEEASLCLTSKLCIENAKINKYSSIVIMEDDFKFNNGWVEVFRSFISHLPDDWDLLYLGQAKFWNEISNRKVESVNDHVDRIKFGCGAHFIAIRESIYDLCVSLIGSLTNKLDNCYWDVMKDPSYNCYGPKVSLADSISAPDKQFVSKIPNFDITEYVPSRLSDL